MRLSRKNRTYKDIGYKSSGGIPDLIDNAIKVICRINDKEYDYLCSSMSDEELNLLTKEESWSFAEKRKFLMMLENHLQCMKSEI